MTRQEARNISEKHKFTKEDLEEILQKAYSTLNPEFWEKPNKVNPIFNNGAYFNSCVLWVSEMDDKCEKVSSIVAFRVLEVFGRFSKIQPYKKKKPKPTKIQIHQKPSLKPRNPEDIWKTDSKLDKEARND